METPTTNKKSAAGGNDEIGSARILPGGERESTVWSDDRRRAGYGALDTTGIHNGSIPSVVPPEVLAPRPPLPDYVPTTPEERRRQSPLVWGAIIVILCGGVFIVSHKSKVTPTTQTTAPKPSSTPEAHGGAMHATTSTKHENVVTHKHVRHPERRSTEAQAPVVHHPNRERLPHVVAHPQVQRPVAVTPIHKAAQESHATAAKPAPKKDDSNSRADKFFNE